MTQPDLLHAADYADALITARRAKNAVFLVVLLVLIIELSLFFVARYTKVLNPAADDAKTHALRGLLQWVVGLIDFIGLILPALLAVVLLLILNVMLVGRSLGTGPITAAFLATVILILLLFPWQSFLNNPVMTGDPAAVERGLKVPGALYTWAELIHTDPATHNDFGATFPTSDPSFAFLRWTRFVAFPVFCIILLLLIQTKSNRGLRQALGNAPAAADAPKLSE